MAYKISAPKAKEQIGDVWELETQKQQVASEELDVLYVQPALRGHKKSQIFLEKLWGEKWGTIKNKLETEGSVWYVWWMYGVDKYREKRK